MAINVIVVVDNLSRWTGECDFCQRVDADLFVVDLCYWGVPRDAPTFLLFGANQSDVELVQSECDLSDIGKFPFPPIKGGRVENRPGADTPVAIGSVLRPSICPIQQTVDSQCGNVLCLFVTTCSHLFNSTYPYHRSMTEGLSIHVWGVLQDGSELSVFSSQSGNMAVIGCVSMGSGQTSRRVRCLSGQYLKANLQKYSQ